MHTAEQRTVPRGNHLNLMTFRFNQYADKRDEPSLGHIVDKQLVESIHVAPQILFVDRCPRIGPAHRRHQSGTNAMSRYVGERNQDSPVREHLPVEVVSAGLVSGTTPSSDVVTWHIGFGAGQQTSLDLAGDIEVALHPLSNSFLYRESFDVSPQISRHAIETM